MSKSKQEERQIVRSLEEVPNFASEDEERAWWATHDLAEELGVDGTKRHQTLVRRLSQKVRSSSPARRKSVA
ncbi:hypothetical protein FJZ31_05465 [Candidatus Poribacteria bacterium]|nr:hypothetical protein [Candidatus Poribacteria bacterium]